MRKIAIGMVLFGLAGTAGAVTTKTWSTATYKEFDEGDGKGVLVSSLGEVTPGNAADRVDLETDAMWTAVRADDGTIYAGGVTDGTIYAIAGGKQRKVVSLDKETPWIGALAIGPDGTLYAGTLATGAIYAIDTRAGKAAKIADLDGAEHVWALVFDGKTLYAATGASGKLYAVDVAGKKASVVWSSGESHLLSLVRAKDGALWAGTADEALLYRFDPKTKEARAIADFAGTEIKAIVETDGAFVVAVNEFAGGTAAPAKAGAPKGTAAKAPEPGSGPGADASKSPDPSRTGERKGKGALFRVEPDGRVEQLHALADSYFQGLAVDDAGSLFAAAGAQGRVYEVRKDRTVVTAYDVDERQVNAVMAGGKHKDVAFVTGDKAAAYVSAGNARDATYTSKIFDALFPARWGNLRWRGAGAMVIETRSGNTSKTDRGWSGWQKLGGVAKAGGDAMSGNIASPAARYLQYRVSFGAGDRLNDVTVYYLPQNQRPRVTEITVGDGVADAARPPVTTQGGAAKPRSPILKLRWKVENPDGDELAYTVEYRPEGSAEWQPVPTGADPLLKAEFDWNTEALPDGYYKLRVTASDARVNPRDLALENAYVSPAFLIDNQKPVVGNLEVKYPFATGRATDSFSRIDEIAYAIDGGEWIMAFPKDGIFDDLSELFTVKLPADLKPGAHTLSIRIADEADNIGAAATTFRINK